MADILYDTRNNFEDSSKVIILTHGDADGLVAAVIIKNFEELEDKNKSFLIMSSMDVTLEQTDKTLSYICNYNSLGKRDKLYILDRPIPSLNWLKMRYLCDTQLINIDHHLTNHPDLYRDESCCKDIKFLWDDKVSAAYLALEWFRPFIDKDEKYKKLYEKFLPLAEATSSWDTFSWKKLGSSKEDLILKDRALSINSAEKILGTIPFYHFINAKTEVDNYTEVVFSYFSMLHDAYDLKVEAIYNFARRSIYNLEFKKYKFGVIYGIEGDYYSIIADKIFSDKKMKYDILAFINIYGSASFRSKNDIDVSELAKKIGELSGYSGGGHKNAAGCKLYDRDETKSKILQIFEEALLKAEYLI